jgi:hypothetical protein
MAARETLTSRWCYCEDASIFVLMSSRWTWAYVLGCAGMAGFATSIAAANTVPVDANPYSIISDRNIFHLNPPPPPVAADDVKPPEQRKIMLTGMIKKRDSWEILLEIPPKDGKDSPIYLSLAPGEKEKDVELVKVRYDKEEVDIINAGIPETLTVKSNSYDAVGPPAVAHAPGAPPPGIPGFGRRPGFPPRNGLPMPPRPSAAVTPSGGSAIIAGGGSGSAIISGGGGVGNAGSAYSPFGGSSSGAIVSGGSPFTPTGAVPGNNAGTQIANNLFNQPASFQMPTPTAPPAPPEVQAAGMLLHEAAGGPPAPPLPGEIPEPPASGGTPGFPVLPGH